METVDRMSNQLEGSDMSTLPSINGSSNNISLIGDTPYPADQTLEIVQYNSLSQNELNSIVNVTREYPFDYATIMFGYMMPFVLLLTLITNTLVVVVLFQRHMRTPTNIVLLTMAIVDLATLLSPSPWYFYIYTLGYHDKFLYPPMACYVHHIMTDVIPVFFHTSSIWLALLLASQRYIYVCHPTLARTWCTVPRVRKAIIIILVIAFLHQLTRFFDNTFTPIVIRINETKYPACKIEISDWVRVIATVYYTTYFTFRILFVFIIPCVALITLNCLLFRALRRAENKRTELLRTKFKLIGGEQCSVVEPIDLKRSSFIDTNCNNRHLANEITSTGLMMAINRKPSASAILSASSIQTRRDSMKQQVNIIANSKNIDNLEDKIEMNSGGDKNRNFLITLFHQTTKQPGARGCQNITDDPNGSMIKFSPSANHQMTDDTLGRVGHLSEVRYGNDNAQILKDKLLDDSKRSGRRRRRSEEDSNDTCSMASSPSARDDGGNPVDDNHNQCQLTNGRRRRRRRSIGNGEKDECDDENVGFGGRGEDDDDDVEEEEEEFTCLECATCEADPECQRCSAGAIKDGATSNSGNHHRHRHHQNHNLHQAMSQCSSLLEGATNTTTNDDEDVSSCAIMNHQNASSSMYVIHDGNGDQCSGSASSIRANQDEKNNSSSQDIGPPTNITTAKDTTKMEKSQLSAGSGSIDSRSTCGVCRNGSKKGKSGSAQCRDCCLENRYKRRDDPMLSHGEYPSDRKMLTRTDRHSKCEASCSNSDPCMNCNIDSNSNNNNNCSDVDQKMGQTDGYIIHGSGENLIIKSALSTSQSGYVGEPTSENATANPYDTSMGEIRPPCTNTTTTTTTTTLYSTKTNSIGSLLQVQNQAGQPQPITSGKVQQQLQTSGPSQSSGIHSSSAYIKSPSIASTSGRARSSTLGPTGIPGALVSSTTASLRTMDSNRTTLMLIVVVTVFLMVEVPVAISHILHVVFNSFDAFKDIEFASSLNYIKLFTNFFIMISYSVNFTIYCSMSKKFRETFRDLFLCGKRAKRKRAKRLLYEQQQQQLQQSQYTQHHFNIQENQTQLANNIINNNNANNSQPNRAHHQNENPTTHISGINHHHHHQQLNSTSVGVMRYSPYSGTSCQQEEEEECEL